MPSEGLISVTMDNCAAAEHLINPDSQILPPLNSHQEVLELLIFRQLTPP